jgi:tetratricopeptide (TPR) repeat protein
MRVLVALVVSSIPLASPTWAVAPRPAAPPTEPQTRARALYVEGSALYEEGRYPEAIARFESAYQLYPRPELLFNIAQAYRLQGPAFCEAALHYYEWHLHDQPGASNRREIEERMTQMRACVEAQLDAVMPLHIAPAPAAPEAPVLVVAAPVPRVDQAPRRRSHWPVWTSVIGAATTLAGGTTYAIARAKYESVKAGAPYPRGTFRGWERLTDVSYGLLAAGAATTGLSLFVWLWPESGSRSPSTARAAVGLRGTF